MPLVNGNYKDNCEANRARDFTHRYVDERLAEIAKTEAFYHATGIDLGNDFLRDETLEYMIGWLAPIPFYDEVPTKEETLPSQAVGLAIPVDIRESEVNWRENMTAYDMVNNVNIKDFGVNVSKWNQARLDLINYLQSEPGQDLMNKLIDEGYEIPEIYAIATGLTSEDAYVSLPETEEGTVFCANRNLYDMLTDSANRTDQSLNVHTDGSIEALIERFILDEEVTHLFRDNDVSNIVELLIEELGTKKFLHEFYEDKEKGSEAKIYKFLKEKREKDIKTTAERYFWSRLRASDKGYTEAEIDALLEEFTQEAKNMDYSDDEASKYASARLEEYVREDKEDSEDSEAKESKKENADESKEDSEQEESEEDGGESEGDSAEE